MSHIDLSSYLGYLVQVLKDDGKAFGFHQVLHAHMIDDHIGYEMHECLLS